MVDSWQLKVESPTSKVESQRLKVRFRSTVHYPPLWGNGGEAMRWIAAKRE
jgi:hypothetical protein